MIENRPIERGSEDDEKIAMKVSKISIVMNLLLALLKFLAGVIASSGAMISDAVHSASDVFSTLIVIAGVKISNKESDHKHQYGHERLECVASIVLAVILLATGLGIGYSGIEKITGGDYEHLKVPGILALAAAVVSIVIKEWMYWYTRNAAKKINSGALMADAWHHRSDAMSSVGALIGIFGARMGYPVLDPLASVIICIFIGKAAFDVFEDAVEKMVDKSCDDETVAMMRDIILAQQGVKGIDDIRTRIFASKIFVDVEISADGDISLRAAHQIAENVHDEIERKIPSVKHCMVHMNPAT